MNAQKSDSNLCVGLQNWKTNYREKLKKYYLKKNSKSQQRIKMFYILNLEIDKPLFQFKRITE